MDEGIILIHEVAARFQSLMETKLLPLDLAEEFERLDKVYRRRLKNPRWSIRRWELRSVVDEVIIAILSDSTGLPSRHILHRMPNETLLFYFDRLLCAQASLAEFAQEHEGDVLEVPASWDGFWIHLLVDLAAPPDPDSI